MLSKFKMPDDVPNDDPRFELMETWAAFSHAYVTNMDNVGVAYKELLIAESLSEGLDYAATLEATLQEKSPELVMAGNALRGSLDKITGWKIDWLHHERRDFTAASGWIVGSLVGGDPVTLGYRAWLEVGDRPHAPTGPLFQLAQMYEIELTPAEE